MTDALIFVAACALTGFLVVCLVLASGVMLYALGLLAGFAARVLRSLLLALLAVLRCLIAWQTKKP